MDSLGAKLFEIQIENMRVEKLGSVEKYLEYIHKGLEKEH
jgi:hypothetical protein